MNQSEHIDSLVKLSKKREELTNHIQRIYFIYLTSNLDKDFEGLIMLLDEYCLPWVRKKLWMAGCYSDENEHTAMQEARIAVWENIRKDRAAGDPGKDTFVRFAFNIYKHKVLDIVRKVSRSRTKMDICSMEETVGKTIEESTPAVDTKMMDEMRQMYDKLFQIYCKGFLNSKAFPPRSLALYYARVLPHLLCAIPDTKAASAKWAFERMGNRTLWELKEDSENNLQKNVAADLHWCGEFIRQLNEKSDKGDSSCILKNIVYTSKYKRGKIEDWADSMHKTTVKAVMYLLSEDKELFSQVEEYISQADVLGCIYRGGKRR